MAMRNDWTSPGQVNVNREGDVTVVRLTGNLHRDLFPAQRDTLEAELRSASDAGSLVVDLCDVVRLDSWGEGVIADVVDEVIAQSGRAAIVYDRDRPHHVRSLRVLLKRHDGRVRFGGDGGELRGWVTEET
jgi:anti-anti-sigma factor